MNFLQSRGRVCQKIAFVMIIAAFLAMAVGAQNPPPQQQGKMYGDPGFVGEPINLRVVNADVREILNYITEQYGINFVIDRSVPAVPVTINVNDVPWNIALDAILRSQELGVQVNGSILRIAQAGTLATEGEIQRKAEESQLDNSPLYTEFIRLNYAFGAGSLQGSGTTTGKTSTNNPGASGGGGGNDQGILGIIKRRLSRRGAVEVDGRSNTLIITDVRQNIDAIRQLVFLLDQPEPQVEIEARIVVATRNFSRDLGVQLSALAIGTRGAISAGTLPGSATPATTNPGGFPTGVGGINGTIQNTVIGITGIFGTAQIGALITAGESKGQAKTIATPRVTTLNNRPAEIQSGSQVPVTTVQPGGAIGGAPVITTEYVSVPLRLAVTPQITDVGTVILDITAENSNVSGGSGAAPTIATQSMQAQVMVPDGGTTVIGGVLVDVETDNEDRTPGLSRIPIIGNLFKRKGISRVTNELLFFITPRIYRPDFQGRQTEGKVSDSTRSTTILQPVPLGNPPSNSDPVQNNNNQQPVVTPVVPVVPTTNPNVQPNQPATKPQ